MHNHRRSLTLVEVIVATFVLALVMLGFMAASSATAAQRTLAQEDLLAEQLLSDLLADLRGLETPALLTGTDWTIPASDALFDASFRVVLVHDEVGPDGIVATALEITSASGTLSASTLTNTEQLTRLGLLGGLDLNADGDVEDGALPISTEEEQKLIRLVPALLEITWRSVAGKPRSQQIHAYLSDY